MARISLIDENTRPDLTELVAEIQKGRRGQLLNLYRLLLHTPDVAKAWFETSNAVRWKTGINGRLRELVIVRIGLIVNVDYIIKQHIPALTEPEGITALECAALQEWRSAACFSELERAALAFADAITREGTVSDEIFETIGHHFNERQIVELTILIGFFNMAARVMSALRIDPQFATPFAASAPLSTPTRSRVSVESPITIVVEEDVFLRLIGVLLDHSASKERFRAFADFFAHDEPDFAGYRERLRAKLSHLFPAHVRMAGNTEELRKQLPGAHTLIVESLKIGPEELDAGRDLLFIQEFGAVARNIDTEACARRGIDVLTQRRRSSAACAETTLTLMLTLARKFHRILNKISAEQLAAEGGPFRPFDRRHTPNANWARIPGLRTLYQSTLGIIGVGEIGREIVIRAAAFGMRILYNQRTRLSEGEERALHLTYVPLDRLFAESDWIVPQIAATPATKNFIDRERFAQMKPGAFLVNISRADLVNRDALLEALKSGRLGGFALDPLYEAPGRADDELLRFPNVIMSPHIAAQPRFNVLRDLDDMLTRMDRKIGGLV